MKRHKWHALIILGLVIIVASISACTKGPGESQYAPEFTLQAVDGSFVSLDDFKSKPIMLTFWPINCSACQFQAPFMEELFSKWSSDSIVVLTINVGDRAVDVQDYMNVRNISYPVLLDTHSKVGQSYGLVGVPTTFFIDGDGKVQAYHIGAFQSEQAMESAINEVFPAIALNPKTSTSAPALGALSGGTGPEIGKVAPDFNLIDINDQSISLSQLRGKTVLLNFWMSTCDACVAELPYLQTVSDNLTGQPIVILAVNCGESSLAVHSAVDRLQLSYPVLLDPDGKVCAAYKHGAPTAFLIDSTGVIKAIKDDAFENPGEVSTMLDSLFLDTQ